MAAITTRMDGFRLNTAVSALMECPWRSLRRSDRQVLCLETFPWHEARIGVLSDTHISRRARALPEAVLRGLAGCDLILHAGDIQVPEVLTDLERLAPVRAVVGNVDPPDMADRLGYERTLAIGAWRLGLVHGHREPPPLPGLRRPQNTLERALACFADVHCVVFGHSHVPLCQPVGDVLAFNPGSPTDRRRSPHPSYGVLHVSDAGVHGEIVYF